MNNQIPFFNPFNNIQPFINQNEYNRVEEKIDRIEKRLRILENKVAKLDNSNSYNKNNHYVDEPTDMYMI